MSSSGSHGNNSAHSDSEDDVMKQIDDFEPEVNSENVEKSLCNLNIHAALISSQMVELTKAYQEFSANFNKQMEMMWEELRSLKMEAAGLNKNWRKGV